MGGREKAPYCLMKGKGGGGDILRNIARYRKRLQNIAPKKVGKNGGGGEKKNKAKKKKGMEGGGAPRGGAWR